MYNIFFNDNFDQHFEKMLEKVYRDHSFWILMDRNFVIKISFVEYATF